MKNNFKRMLSLLLIFVLLIPSISMASVEENSINRNINIEYSEVEETEEERKESLIRQYSEGEELNLEGLLEDSSEVKSEKLRVLVEVEGKSLLESAMNKGVKVSELSKSFKTSEERSLLNTQNRVKTSMERQGLDGEYLRSYTNVINGFSMEVDSDLIEIIEDTPGVKNVELVNEYKKPEAVSKNMENSNGMIGSSTSWTSGYNGEGMLVAVLDTGADPYHKDFVISEGTKVALTKDKLKELVSTYNLEGKYYNAKVPYAYNYYDKSNTIVHDDGASQHGMHVSGTVLANGDVSKGGIKGVAPEAQLLSMKVFSNDVLYDTTFTDIYLKAIDDAIALGADAINMSLGSPAGFYLESSIEHEALARAEKAGIISSISSGNSRHIGYGGSVVYGRELDIYAHNPDTGVVGSPSVSTAALTVASANNVKIFGKHMEARPEIAGIEEMMINETGERVFSELGDPEGYEYVLAGIGKETDFEAVGDKVRGKIALVKRGNDFSNTLGNAQKAGAIACIVYNHEAGGDILVNMSGGDDAKIPFGFTSNRYGKALVENIDVTKLVFPQGPNIIPNPIGGSMAESSSWGVSADLRLKPEITGPGGGILSTQNNNKYIVMSGTSMSSPHAAGASVLVKDYINKNTDIFTGLSEEEISLLVRNLMMNTSNIIKQVNSEVPYSPRVQGAGMMDLEKATSNKATLLDVDNNTSKGRAKVEFGQVDGDLLNFKLELKNYGNENLEYKVSTKVINQIIKDNILTDEFALFKEDKDIQTVSIKSKESKVIEFTLDISGMVENQFVDGFVELEEITGRGEDIGIPFLGFKGNWSKPRVIDSFNGAMFNRGLEDPKYIHENEIPSQFKYSGFAIKNRFGEMLMNPNEMYYKQERIALFRGNIRPYITQLRNSNSTGYYILDKDENVLRFLGKENYSRKVHSMDRGAVPARVARDGNWDGKINNENAPEGKYIYRIESELQYNKEKQFDDFPIIVDSIGPELHDLDESESNYQYYDYKLKIRVSDTIGEGLSAEDVSSLYAISIEDRASKTTDLLLLDDDKLELTKVDESKDLYDIVINLREYLEEKDNTVVISAVDRAENISTGKLTVSSELDEGHFFIKTPEHLEYYGTDDKAVMESGKLSVDISSAYLYGWNNKGEEDSISELKVNGVEVEDITFVEHVRIVEGKNYLGEDIVFHDGPAYKFNHKVELESGYQGINITAKSKADSLGRQREIAIVRYIFVDLEYPTLDIEILEVKDGFAKIKVTAGDNLNYVSLSKSGSFLASNEDKDKRKDESSELEYLDTVRLKNGLNEIQYIAKDRLYDTKDGVRIFHSEKGLDGSKLLKLLDEAEKIDLSKYTEASRKGLYDVYNDTKTLLTTDFTQEQIDEMVIKFENAIGALKEEIVDRTKLKELIDEVEGLDKDNYTEDSYANLLVVLEEAKSIYNDKDVKKADITLAEMRLSIALRRLVLIVKEEVKVEKSVLEGKVEEVSKLDLNRYTDATAEKVKDALDKANAILVKEDTSEEEVASALKELEKAVGELEEKIEEIRVDKSVLEEKVEEVSKLDLNRYTDATAKKAKDALDKANTILVKEDASEEEVISTLKELEKAVGELEEKVEEVIVDKSVLEEKVEEVSKLDLNSYTEATAKKVKDALDKAKTILVKEDVSEEEVASSLKELGIVVGGLKEKEVEKSSSISDFVSPTLPSSGGSTGSGKIEETVAVKIEAKVEKPEVSKPEDKKEETALETKLELEKNIAYITGYVDNTIRADKEISREEVATIITRILNDKYKGSIELKDMKFKDVAEDRWSAEAIRTLYSMGLIEGYKDGTYRPEANISRAEFATIINRLGELELGKEKVVLKDIEGHWGENYIKNMVSNGYVDRIENEKYRPNEELLRYEMIVIINKVLAKDSIDLDKNIKLPDYKDLKGDEWYFEDIMKSIIIK